MHGWLLTVSATDEFILIELTRCFTEALAWVPQLTVAEVSFRGGLALEARYPWIEMLLQVHDSIVFQVPQEHDHRLEEIATALICEVPYTSPHSLIDSVGHSPVSRVVG